MAKKKQQQVVVEKDEKPNKVEERRNASSVMKKRRRAEEKDVVTISREDNTLEGKTEEKSKSSRKKKSKNQDTNISKSDQLGDGVRDGFQEDNGKLKKSGKKGEGLITSKKGKKSVEKKQRFQTAMSLVKDEEVEADDVYDISSVDADCSKGMRKWVAEYHQNRPGLNILQERIDEFITSHEAQLEQNKKEREDRAAEGGWTVVVHHKGRKKTTDSESGITVGSVAQAVVENKMTKKKNKEVGLDFYRFQKRESQRNEIMMLQSKFEQDKKRIQQLRAARKFRPY